MTEVDDRRARLAELLRAGCGERPLSSGEEALWLSHAITGDGTTATTVFTARLSENPDAEALARALQAVVLRHDVLRTTYHDRDGVPYAIVRPDAPVGLTRSSTHDPAQLRELVAAELADPFDLTRGPLLRAHLVDCVAEGTSVFVLSMHHIVTDLWSATLLAEDLRQLYDVECGRRAPLPPAVARFRDHVTWQRAFTTSAQGERDWAYWRDELVEPLPTLTLPTDRPRAAVRSHHGDGFSLEVPAALRRRVEELSRHHSTTPFTVLLAGFQVTLHRWTGQSDVLVGTPLHGRHRAEFADTVGLFVNELPIRSRVDSETTFTELLAATDQRVRRARAHGELPFADLVKRLGVMRDRSRGTVHQAVFALESTPDRDTTGRLHFAGPAVPEAELSTRSFGVSQSIGEADLSVMAAPLDGGYAVRVDWAAELFDSATVRAIVDSWLAVLDDVVAEPGRRVRDAPLLSSEGRADRLAAMRGEHLDHRLPDTLTGCLTRSVRRAPHAVALRGDDGRRLTYAELERAAHRVARNLRARGVRRGDRVAVCVPRSFEAVVAIYGVLFAGAAYVPLDPSYAPARLRYMVEDSGARVTVVAAATAELAATWTSIRLRVDERQDPVSPPLTDGPRGSDCAYVVYTSGSTGKPKGVLVEHASVVNHNGGMAQVLDLRTRDRVLQFQSLSFDGAVEEIFTTLSTGATLVVPADPGLISPPELERLVAAAAVTVVDLPTAYWHQWVDSVDAGLAVRCPTLRAVLVGGEAAASAKVDRWRQQGGVRWINTYGPTEATVVCTTHEPGAVGHGVVPIGRPLPNTDAFVLDEQLEPVPVGMIGELCVGGIGVARGYHNRPELTADRFIANPHGEGRLYRTGDLVRTTAAGDLEYLGRRDRQVKIRGYRVEPGEIEAALTRCDGVAEAAVVVRDDASGQPTLIGYVTGSADPAAVRRELAEWLPPYLVPHRLVALDALPMTGSGKIDRAALPEPERASTPPGGAAPSTAMQQTLLDVWTEVLGVAALSVDDNFFASGGDSIQAMRVVARAAAAGVTFTARALFEHQSVAALAAALTAGAVTPPMVPTPAATGRQPLLPVQQWFFDQDHAVPHHWAQSVLLRAPGSLDPTVLSSALDAVVGHHDALRLAFSRADDGAWTASYRSAVASVPVSVVDLASDADRDVAADATATVLHAAHRLDRPPLLRAAVLRTAGQPDLVVLSAHHLVVDAVSWRVLADDLTEACTAIARGEAVSLPPRAGSMQTRAAELHGGLDDAPDWARVPTSPTARLEVDHPDAPDLELTAQRIDVILDATATSRLGVDVAIRDAVVAAVAHGLRDWTEASSLPVYLEGHGRDPLDGGADLSRAVGWFTAQYPIEVPLGLSPARAREAVRAATSAVRHGGVGWGAAVRDTGDAAEVCVNHLGVLDGPVRGNGFSLERVQPGQTRAPDNRRPNLLEIDAYVLAGRLTVSIGFGARHDRDRIERLAVAVRDALVEQSLLTAPLELPLLPLQRGVLVDTLASGDSHAYVGQLVVRFATVDGAALRRAVSLVVARHPALRTVFVWADRDEAAQVVLPDATVDWRDVEPTGHEQLEDALRADRAEPLDWSRPPHRWTLVAEPSGAAELIWTHHHIQLDGWSLAIVLADLLACYQAENGTAALSDAAGSSVEPLTRWLEAQDPGPAEAYWRDALAGSAVTVLSADVDPSRAGTGEHRFEVSAVTAAAVEASARRGRVTAATLYHAAWALLLARRTGGRDLRFGTVSSGRSAPVAGIESMVGLLANALPVRARLDDAEPVTAWLARWQQEEAVRREFEHTPAAMVRRAARLPSSEVLFESLVVVENYPVGDAVAGAATAGVTDIALREGLDQPLGVEIAPGTAVRVTITYRADHFEHAEVEEIGRQFATAVDDVAHAAAGNTVGELISNGSMLPANAPRRFRATLHDATVVPPLRTGEPHGEIERALADIWRTMLAVPVVERDDDFLSLGGDSIRAIRLVELCRAEFDVALPLRAVLETPTLAGLAAVIGTARETPPEHRPAHDPRESSALTLRRGSVGATDLFLVHPISGQATVFAALARALPGDGGVHAFESTLPAGTDQTLTGLAHRYADAVIARAPGRYVLAGYSLGAVIAVEAARALTAAGRPPARLVLLDPATAWGPSLPPLSAHQLAIELAGLDGLDTHGFDSVRAVHAAARQAGRPVGALPLTDAERLAEVAATHHEMLRGHRVVPYPGPADVLVVHDHPYVTAGAGVLLSGSDVRVRVVPGTHSTLVEHPHVSHTAAALGDAMAGG